ncbi:hypothetical protein GCM10027294_54050 [Marinactinospora endophytica]
MEIYLVLTDEGGETKILAAFVDEADALRYARSASAVVEPVTLYQAISTFS